MIQALSPRTSGWLRRLGLALLRFVLVAALVAGWAALELHAARTRALARAAAVAVTVESRFAGLASRLAAVMNGFDAADATTSNRIAVAVRMLRAEPALVPAENLFLYDAKGQFVAATLPLLPNSQDVSERAWFRAAQGQVGALTFFQAARAPLGLGKGFVIIHTLTDAEDRFAGVIGTFLSAPALQNLVIPPDLSPSSTIRLALAPAAAPILTFSADQAPPHPGLDAALAWMGESSQVSAAAQLPGGLIWRVEANVFSGIAPAETHTILWHAALVAAGCIFLLWFGRQRQRTTQAVAPAASTAPIDPAATEAAPVQATAAEPALMPAADDMEWVWELDARGRLVGVAGNPPAPLLAAVGTNFLDLLADDPQSSDLREAIAEHEPVRGLELALVLPGSPKGRPRRFRLNGRAVTDTGGFWGTASEVLPRGSAAVGAD